MKTPLTTVSAAKDTLFVGEAHNDCVRVVDKTNPEMVLQTLNIPGGQPNRNLPGLFGDRIVHWNDMVFISQPLDMNERGGYCVYKCPTYIPLAMQIGVCESAQHASQIKRVSDDDLLISAQNAVYRLASRRFP